MADTVEEALHAISALKRISAATPDSGAAH
jgi:hypothetical protein